MSYDAEITRVVEKFKTKLYRNIGIVVKPSRQQHTSVKKSTLLMCVYKK